MPPPVLALVILFAAAVVPHGAWAARPGSAEHWVGSWASAQQIPEPHNALAASDLTGATLRQIVHLSVGGSRIRLRVSNAFGTGPLHLLAVHVAHPLSPATSRIEAHTDRIVTFDEHEDVSIPAGAEYVSDPLDYPVTPLSDLAVTIQLDLPPEQQTGHPGSRTTSYLAKGAAPSAPELQGKTVEHWYFLSGVDVSAGSDAVAVAILGDSITDGHGVTTNGNDRWPDILAARLQRSPPTKSVAVLNLGIGGNRVLADGNGPNALARFDRDVLAREGVRYLMVLEGINDIGELTRTHPATEAQHEDLVRRMIGVYRQITLRAHYRGIKVIGATIMPFMGSEYYHPGPENEKDRRALNAWIRAPGHFDAVMDFDRLTADPAHPDRLGSQYDSGDHLHPRPPGYRAMGEAVPLALFSNRK